MSSDCGQKIRLTIGSGVREYRPMACIGLISVLLMLLVDCCTVEGKEVCEDSYNSMELSEEEAHGSDEGNSEWKKMGKGGEGGSRKRKKQDKDSQGGTDNGGREEKANNPKTGSLFVVVVRFEGGGGVKKMDPLKLKKIIRAQVGEVKYARVPGDGNTEKQVDKARKILSVKVKVGKLESRDPMDVRKRGSP